MVEILTYNNKEVAKGQFMDYDFSVFRNGEMLQYSTRPIGTKYVSIVLADGTMQKAYIKRLIAQEFLPNPHKWTGVRVKNGDRGNLSIENVEWFEKGVDKEDSREGLLNKYSLLDEQGLCEDEQTLLKYFKTQDNEFIGDIYKKYYSRWTGMLLVLTEDKDKTMDILQESFERFKKCVDTGRYRIGDGTVNHCVEVYIKRILRNTYTMGLRKSRKMVYVDEFKNHGYNH